MTDVPGACQFAEGDRVAASSRPGFPVGTVMKLMDRGFVLVRWDGNMLETAYHLDLARKERE